MSELFRNIYPSHLFLRDKNSYAQIDIDDLHDPESSNGVLLEMQERQRYFENSMAKNHAQELLSKEVCCLIDSIFQSID